MHIWIPRSHGERLFEMSPSEVQIRLFESLHALIQFLTGVRRKNRGCRATRSLGPSQIVRLHDQVDGYGTPLHFDLDRFPSSYVAGGAALCDVVSWNKAVENRLP